MTVITKETAGIRRLEAPFILVTGGKGGVGKTTMAAHLGVGLAREKCRVLLVDLDLGLANLHIALELTPARTIEDVLRGEASISECIAKGPGGVDVLPAGSGTEAMGRLDASARSRLSHELAEISRDYDLVVGDSSAGIGPEVLGFASIADRVLVVTTPEVAALTDAYGLIKALDEYGTRGALDIPTPELLVNLVPSLDEAQRIERRLRGVCERFLSRSPRAAGWMPASPEFARRSSVEQRIVRKSLEGHCLRQMTQRLLRLGTGTVPAV